MRARVVVVVVVDGSVVHGGYVSDVCRHGGE